MTEDEMRAAVAPMIELLRAAAPGDSLAVLRASGDFTCNYIIGSPDLGMVVGFARILMKQVTETVAAIPPEKRTPQAKALAERVLRAEAVLSGAADITPDSSADRPNALLVAIPAGNA